MAPKRGRRTPARKRQEKRRKAILGSGALLLILLAAFWSTVWPYLLAAVVLGSVGSSAWWLWRTDRLMRRRDRGWREQDAVQAGHPTLAAVDTMSGTEFEDLVAALCRRDGCTDVRRVGAPGTTVPT